MQYLRLSREYLKKINDDEGRLVFSILFKELNDLTFSVFKRNKIKHPFYNDIISILKTHPYGGVLSYISVRTSEPDRAIEYINSYGLDEFTKSRRSMFAGYGLLSMFDRFLSFHSMESFYDLPKNIITLSDSVGKDKVVRLFKESIGSHYLSGLNYRDVVERMEIEEMPDWVRVIVFEVLIRSIRDVDSLEQFEIKPFLLEIKNSKYEEMYNRVLLAF